MFLYMMAFMLTSVVEQAFFLYKACRVNHGFTEEVCQSLDLNLTLKKDIQVLYHFEKPFFLLILNHSI